MSTFPLYDTLERKASGTRPLTDKEKLKTVSSIKKMDTDRKQLIYALIRSHSLRTEESNSSVRLPYGGTVSRVGVSFDLEKLPIKLQWIIHEFAKNKKTLAERRSPS